MAKKRKSKRAKPARKSSKVANKKPQRALKVADVLVSIAIFFLILNAILLFIFPNAAVDYFAANGVQTTVSTWIYLGVSWMFLALFAYTANKFIKQKHNRHQMWGLLVVGILTAITTRIESAALIIIAAIIYLVKARKR